MGMSGYSRRRRAEEKQRYKEWYASLTPEEKAQEALRLAANEKRFQTSMLAIMGSIVLLILISHTKVRCSSDRHVPHPTGMTGASGAPCAQSSDCESQVCFSGNQSSYCSLKCTQENARSVCVAPFNGICNKHGFCRLP